MFQTRSTTGTFLITAQLLLTPPPLSYHFVAAAGEAAETSDRHLKAATPGHDVWPLRKLLKEQKTSALWRESGVQKAGKYRPVVWWLSPTALQQHCISVWHVTPLIALPPALSHPLWVSSLLFNWDSRWDGSIFQRCVLLLVLIHFHLNCCIYGCEAARAAAGANRLREARTCRVKTF